MFDEPEVAAADYAGLPRRLFALQIRDALKYLEKNVPDLQKMAVAYMPLGTAEELRQQIIDVALDRAFLTDPLPATETDFKQRVDEGRGAPDPDRQRDRAPVGHHPDRIRGSGA